MVRWKSLRKKIPSHIKIMDLTYEVAYIDQFKDDKTMGETRFDTKQILIKNGLSDKETIITYLHEVLHLMSFASCANLTETQVLALEAVIPSILKSNAVFKK